MNSQISNISSNGKEKKRYFLAYFLIFLFLYIAVSFTPSKASIYVFSNYAKDFSLGFVPRGIIGELFFLIFKRVTFNNVYLFVTVFTMLMIGIVSWFLSKVTYAATDKTRTVIYIICFFFCINPGGISYLFGYMEFGRYDLYVVLLTFICALIIVKNNKLIYLIPVIMTLMIMCHHVVSIFLYIPSLLAVMLLSGVIKKDKRMIIIMIISFFMVSLLFLYFQFFNPLKEYSKEYILQAFQKNADFGLRPGAVASDVYSLKTYVGHVIAQFPDLLPRTMIMLVVYLPFIITWAYIWINSAKNSDKGKKILYILIPLSVLCATPVFLMAVDYGRYLASIIISQILVMLLAFLQGDENVIHSLKKVNAFFNKHIYAVIVITSLYGFIDRFAANLVNLYSVNMQYNITEAIKFIKDIIN